MTGRKLVGLLCKSWNNIGNLSNLPNQYEYSIKIKSSCNPLRKSDINHFSVNVEKSIYGMEKLYTGWDVDLYSYFIRRFLRPNER